MAGESNNLVGCLLKWAERLLLVAGVAALGWCVFAVADARLSQRSARQSLEGLQQAHTLTSPPPRRDLTRGVPLAELSIPRIHLSAVVLHGSDTLTLRRGLGHIENTAMPGDGGNVAIAGHRDSFFRPLRNVQLGDDIFLDTVHERLHYRVSSRRVVESTEVSVLEATTEPTLTLVTCYPFWLVGQAPDRFVVRATRVMEPTPKAATIREQPPIKPIPEPSAGLLATSLKDHGARDDDTLVRRAIEHFRLVYNARLARRGELCDGGPLKFEACSAAVIRHESATATCRVSPRSSDDTELLTWTFTLWKAGSGWVVESLNTQDSVTDTKLPGLPSPASDPPASRPPAF
jgi:sortase A